MRRWTKAVTIKESLNSIRSSNSKPRFLIHLETSNIGVHAEAIWFRLTGGKMIFWEAHSLLIVNTSLSSNGRLLNAGLMGVQRASAKEWGFTEGTLRMIGFKMGGMEKEFSAVCCRNAWVAAASIYLLYNWSTAVSAAFFQMLWEEPISLKSYLVIFQSFHVSMQGSISTQFIAVARCILAQCYLRNPFLM